MPFKMQKVIFFSRKKKYMCLPYLKFSDPSPEIIWPYQGWKSPTACRTHKMLVRKANREDPEQSDLHLLCLSKLLQQAPTDKIFGRVYYEETILWNYFEFKPMVMEKMLF